MLKALLIKPGEDIFDAIERRGLNEKGLYELTLEEYLELKREYRKKLAERFVENWHLIVTSTILIQELIELAKEFIF